MVRGMDGAIQFWNTGAENLYGWRREEALGKDLHRLLRTTFPVPRAEVQMALQDRGSWQGNLIQITRDGSEIVVACQKTMNREGNAVLEIGRDITSQLRAEEALREAERLAAMGRVAGIIAHEINNPLEAIMNIFYLLRNHSSLDSEARHYADLAEQELQRVSHIARQTLSFYRESKQPISVFMPELIEDVLSLQERALKSNRIEVRKRYLTAARVQGFPVELRQVLLNLVSNAIQAMPDGGALGISVREATDWTRELRGIAISIVDTGVGIQPQDAQRLFQPFFSTKSTKGTGLGLWISKGIVQKYDGRISCRSYRNDAGWTTCFRVFLPVARPSNAIASLSAEAETLDSQESETIHKTALETAEK
jgi:PAS domain S-box-containing protein